MGRAAPPREREVRSGKGPAQAGEARNAAIEQMSKRLTRKFQQLERQINDIRAENLRYYHKIGQICLEIKNNPGDYEGLDGTPGLQLMESALSTHVRTLRRAASFAELYTQAQLEKLIGLKNKDTEFQLHWGHIGPLLTVEDTEQRAQFATQAVAAQWDPTQLHKVIKRQENRSPGHGRSHEIPATVAKQLSQMVNLSHQYISKNDTVWVCDTNNVFANIMNLPADQVTEDMAEDLTVLQEDVQRIRTAAEANIAVIARTVEYVRGVLQTRVEKAEAPATVPAHPPAGAAAGSKKRTRHVEGSSPRRAAAG